MLRLIKVRGWLGEAKVKIKGPDSQASWGVNLVWIPEHKTLMNSKMKFYY